MNTADRTLDILLKRLVPVLAPEAVWLFGSRARGDARADSDYDLLIALPDDTAPERLLARIAHDAKRGTGISADIVTCRRSTFERWKDEVGTLGYEVTRHGRLIYGH